ncbi:microtubule-associated protein tau isoform X1 [Hylaeus anthracinus]|uniref:microtubule-associated protein tau isoform X1 n=1 Tax=Hylaeus anthracinus TaxID=313031 RepID=UPI0023B96656|nr:microtubule-associated protein tau isoform X1 [Hylaeus anthracinus]
MDSQKTANDAAESGSDRGGSMVKSSAALPSGFRARPQGPPGSPRQPLNNGPVGQSQPGGQTQQIRFDGRPPFGPPNSGQFAQHRPYGPPRPPVNSFPQRPPPQNQNPPIILNPRFAPSPTNRPGPQQRLRLTNPGSYQAQQSQRGSQPQQTAQQPQQPVFHPQNPQQQAGRSVLAQQQEIAQRHLQRHESLLNIPQQSPSAQKEDKKPTLPRIVIERMADVDDAKKLKQLENSAAKEMRDNTENDDDDDVVMDGNRSPRVDTPKREELIMSKSPNIGNMIQPPKRPESATINGKMDPKSDEMEKEKLNDKNNAANQKFEKSEREVPESVKNSGSAGADSRLSSAKQVEKADDKSESVKTVDKEKSVSPVPANMQDKLNRSDASHESILPTKTSSSEQTLKTPTKTQPEEGQKLSPLSRSPDKSRASTPSETIQNQVEQEQKTPSKSVESSRASTPAKKNENNSDQELKTPSKTPDKSRASTPADPKDRADPNQSKSDQELKVPSKSPDKSRSSTPVEPKISQSGEDLKAQDSSSDKSRVSTPMEINQTKDERESKEATLATSATMNVPAEASDSRKEQKSATDVKSKVEQEPKTKESLQASEELCEKTPTRKESSDSSKCPSPAVGRPSTGESTKRLGDSVTTKVPEKNLSEKLPQDTLAEDSPETKVDRRPTSSPRPVETANDSSKSSVPQEKVSMAESMLSPAQSSDESVKGFDNGQRRSLSPKSPALSSPQTPVSPKSPANSEKSVNKEEKKTTFVEDPTNQTKDDGKKTPDLKIPSKPTTPNVHGPRTPAELDKKSEKKLTATSGIQNGNGMDESVQSNVISATNGVDDSPTKKSSSKSKELDKNSTAGSPVKSPSKSIKSLPRTPETPSSTGVQDKKKVPMNKVQVGAAPSPNLKTVRSKIGSLDNASYKPGGGKVKIENRKLDFSKAQPKIAAKNEKYTPSGGDKKISQVKLQWNAKPKVGSLENATYKPGGGDKKIETMKLDFKDKAKPKVGSKDNAKHTPGGGSVKSSATPPKTPQDTSNNIQTQKIDIKAESKIGSLDNVKHKPGGGDKKIFNDKDYLRQTGSNVESLSGSGSQSPVPPGTMNADKNDLPTSDENLNQEC